MDSETPSEQYGRGMRQSRKSLRAKQAAGLDDAAIKQLSRPSNGTTDPSMITRPSLTPTQQHPRNLLPASMAAGKTPAGGNSSMSTTNRCRSTQSPGTAASSMKAQSTEPQSARDLPTDFATTISQKNKQPSMHPPVEETQRRATPGRPVDSAQPTPIKPSTKVTKPQKGNKKKATKRAVPQQQPKKPPAVRKAMQKSVPDDLELQAARFHIYQWAHPIPTDFLNLSEDWKASKAYVDTEEGKRDDAPELDDWHEFCGTDSMLLPIPLKIGIALNFVGRAKRAFRTGRSFASFEEEELAVDSKAGANAIKDPVERAIALKSVLNNDARLYVYEQLKVRLCHEIWLEPYPEVGETAPSRVILSFDEAGSSSQQLRTQPELPGQFRELHRPQGRPPRMS